MGLEYSKMSEMISELAKKLNDEKERLIKQRISERVGTKYDVFTDQVKRFPKLVKEYHSDDQSEHYYWNDGSDNGLHIISFYQKNNFDINKSSFDLGFNYK